MDIGALMTIIFPLFSLFFAVMPKKKGTAGAVIVKIKKKRGVIMMINEAIKKYKGNNCIISTGTFGATVVGRIIEVEEKWIEVETKKGTQLVNSEFIQSVTIKAY